MLTDAVVRWHGVGDDGVSVCLSAEDKITGKLELAELAQSLRGRVTAAKALGFAPMPAPLPEPDAAKSDGVDLTRPAGRDLP